MYNVNLDPLLINGKPPKRLISKFSRRVYLLDDNNIFKLDSLSNSKYNIDNQTKLELKKYKQIDKVDLKYFPRLLDYGVLSGRTWAVYDNVNLLGKRQQVIPEKTLDVLYYLIDRYDIGDILIDDNLYSAGINNWGLRKDTREIVIFDFGL